MTVSLIAIAAVLMDWWLGEPRRHHPLIGFGRLAIWVETRLYGSPGIAPTARRLRGVLAVAVLLVPLSCSCHSRSRHRKWPRRGPHRRSHGHDGLLHCGAGTISLRSGDRRE